VDRPPSLSAGSRSEAAKPRSAPGGSRRAARKPLADPRRVARAGPKSRPSLPLADRARPKPRRLLRLASRPKPLRSPFRKTLGRSRPVFRGISRDRSPSKSPSGGGWGVKPSPSPCRLEPRGDSRGLRRFGHPFRLRGAFRHRHRRFREIPPRIRLRLCGRGFVRLLAFRFERQRPWGSDGASAWASRPSVRRSVSGPPRFRPPPEAVSFTRFGEAESACG
jgi:hypothetical protein